MACAIVVFRRAANLCWHTFPFSPKTVLDQFSIFMRGKFKNTIISKSFIVGNYPQIIYL